MPAGPRAVDTEATLPSSLPIATAASTSPRPVAPVAVTQSVVSAASAIAPQPVSPGAPAQPFSLAVKDLAALIAAVPGSVEAVAAAPVAGAAGAQLSSTIAGQLAVSTADAMNLWALTINRAIASTLANRIRQAGTTGRVTTSFDPGVSLEGLRLSVKPALTVTYSVRVPINETITVPGQDIPVLGGSVGPTETSLGGVFGLRVNQFSLTPTTLRVPDVTVQLGSPATTVDVIVTATVGGSALTVQPGKLFGANFTIDRIPVNVDGAVSLDIPVMATAAGPIAIQGFDVTGISGTITQAPSLNTSTDLLTINVGVCKSPSNCNHTLRIPDIKLESRGPLLKGVVGGPGISIPINAQGGVGPIGVTLGGLLGPVTVGGADGGAIPLGLTGGIPVNVPITAKLGSFQLDGVKLATGSWTSTALPSSFALWQTNDNWPPPAPWAAGAGTNMIIPVSAISTPTVVVEMPAVKAVIGGPDTTIPINVTGSVGATTATLETTWLGVPTGLTLAGAGGGEIPLAVKADIPIDIPVRVTSTPIQVTGFTPAWTRPAAVEEDLPALDPAVVDDATVTPQSPVNATPTPTVDEVLARVEGFFAGLKLQAVTALNQAGSQLAALPASPLLDAVSRTLWGIRVALAPVGGDVGLWGTADCVASGDCSGQDLAGADLAGQNLAGVNFSSAVLARADLTRANLANATLVAANLSGATLTSANLRNATLNWANLTGVTGLASATMTGANFAGARGVDLSGADLTRKDFTGTNLAGANLTRAKLTGAKLTGATLTGAILTGADLSAINPQSPRPTVADLSGANLIGANLSSANLRQANLTGANLAGADLSGATLASANLRNTDLTFATLSGADGSFSFLGGADLSGANLVATLLPQAVLSNANLAGADLSKANLRFASLSGASLGGATLSGVVWKDTTCPDGTKTSSGCASPPIVIPAFQIGQGGLIGVAVPFPGSCYVGCEIVQEGISATIGAQGPLPGPSTGIVIDPITIGFPDRTALTATIGGPGKGIGLDLTAGAGPVTIPVTSVVPPVIGPIPTVPWTVTVDSRVDVPVGATVSPPQMAPLRTSIPFDVSVWTRAANCNFLLGCSWTGWGGQISLASGNLGTAAAPPPGDVPSAARKTA